MDRGRFTSQARHVGALSAGKVYEIEVSIPGRTTIFKMSSFTEFHRAWLSLSDLLDSDAGWLLSYLCPSSSTISVEGDCAMAC